MKIEHIGYMVGDIHKALENFVGLGYSQTTEIIEDELRGIKICFVEKDAYRIELVSPIDETAVIYQTYKKMGNTPYHICYEVEDIQGELASLRKQGYIVAQPLQPAKAFNQRKVAFLYHKYTGLMELVEAEKSKEVANG